MMSINPENVLLESEWVFLCAKFDCMVFAASQQVTDKLDHIILYRVQF
jgi:hypothetical protein